MTLPQDAHPKHQLVSSTMQRFDSHWVMDRMFYKRPIRQDEGFCEKRSRLAIHQQPQKSQLAYSAYHDRLTRSHVVHGA